MCPPSPHVSTFRLGNSFCRAFSFLLRASLPDDAASNASGPGARSSIQEFCSGATVAEKPPY
jgi:hypothetical protein